MQESGKQGSPNSDTHGPAHPVLLQVVNQMLGSSAAKGAAAAGEAQDGDAEGCGGNDEFDDAPSAEDDSEEGYESDEFESGSGPGGSGPGSDVDMEDIGGAAGGGAVSKKGKGAKSSKRGSVRGPGSDAASLDGAATDSRPQMLNPVQRASLIKQGYKIIGSHSGVKLCRCVCVLAWARGCPCVCVLACARGLVWGGAVQVVQGERVLWGMFEA